MPSCLKKLSPIENQILRKGWWEGLKQLLEKCPWAQKQTQKSRVLLKLGFCARGGGRDQNSCLKNTMIMIIGSKNELKNVKFYCLRGDGRDQSNYLLVTNTLNVMLGRVSQFCGAACTMVRYTTNWNTFSGSIIGSVYY